MNPDLGGVYRWAGAAGRSAALRAFFRASLVAQGDLVDQRLLGISGPPYLPGARQ